MKRWRERDGDKEMKRAGEMKRWREMKRDEEMER